MTDHLKTLRDLVAAGEMLPTGPLRTAYLGDQGGTFVLQNVPMDGCLFTWPDESVVAELAPTCCHSAEMPVVDYAEFFAGSANARPALAALLAEREAMRQALEMARAKIVTGGAGGWADTLAAINDALDAALRDLAPEVEDAE